MEPITLTATAIATVIFSKALEKGGEQLGEAVSNKIGQLLNLIREKFQQEGVEGKLIKAQEDSNEKNKIRFERELVEQMEDDEAFAKQLQELVEQIKAENETIFQSILTDIETDSVKADSVKAEGIDQEAKGSGAVQQEMLKKVKAKTIDAKNLSHKASGGGSEKKSQ